MMNTKILYTYLSYSDATVRLSNSALSYRPATFNSYLFSNPNTTVRLSHSALSPSSATFNSDPFSNIIPTRYVVAKSKPIVIYFSMTHLESIIFRDMVSSKIILGNIYTVFIKVRYDYDNFFMAGSQFSFHYSSHLIDNLNN